VTRATWVWIATAAVLAGLGAGSASARPDARVFYMAALPSQCLIAPTNPAAKSFQLVPCSDPSHNLEVFAVKHGGWGKKTVTLLHAGTVARLVCLASYRKITGHNAAPHASGFAFFIPDPGLEAKRYQDRVVCGYRAWPKLAPLGSGWHVR
jgi:hypothetical protein